jgi:Cu-Zn family superoxide dismutase
MKKSALFSIMLYLITFAGFIALLSGCALKDRFEGTSNTHTVVLDPSSGSNVAGTLDLTSEPTGVRITGLISGLTPGVHAVHIHEKGDCRAKDASSAGEHWHIAGEIHGKPGLKTSHIGDLGNITADSDGQARISILSDRICLDKSKKCSALGRAIIVHSDADDLQSQPAGQSGIRVACGVIR